MLCKLNFAGGEGRRPGESIPNSRLGQILMKGFKNTFLVILQDEANS